MKNVKLLLSLLLVMCMIVCMCACGGETQNEPNDDLQTDPVSDNTPDTSADTEEEAPVAPAFKVTVVDANGNPVQGVIIQICKDVCVPAPTDAEGIATFNNLEIVDGHKLSVLSCPEGYEYTGEAEVYLEAGITEYTVELSEVQ